DKSERRHRRSGVLVHHPGGPVRQPAAPACPAGHTAGSGGAGNPHGSEPEAAPPAGLVPPPQETAPSLAKSSQARLPDRRSRAGSTQALLNSSSKPGSQILNPL